MVESTRRLFCFRARNQGESGQRSTAPSTPAATVAAPTNQKAIGMVDHQSCTLAKDSSAMAKVQFDSSVIRSGSPAVLGLRQVLMLSAAIVMARTSAMMVCIRGVISVVH